MGVLARVWHKSSYVISTYLVHSRLQETWLIALDRKHKEEKSRQIQIRKKKKEYYLLTIKLSTIESFSECIRPSKMRKIIAVA
jgi:hypothetical protein